VKFFGFFVGWLVMMDRAGLSIFIVGLFWILLFYDYYNVSFKIKIDKNSKAKKNIKQNPKQSNFYRDSNSSHRNVPTLGYKVVKRLFRNYPK
jgi:hypothetical protein